MEVHGFTEDGFIEATIDGVLMTVPDTMTNRHRRMIAEWEAEGNTIPPYVPPEPSLPDLAPYQFRAMLKLSGKQDDLYAFIEAMPEPEKTVAQAKLEYSLVFKRDNDLVEAARQAMGLSPEELDDLWLQASQIL